MSKDANHLLFLKIVTDHNLRGNIHSIFKFLHSYFIHKDKPFLISNDKIIINSGCGRRNISYCLDTLEELKIIKRIGQSFNRRFTQGELYLHERALLTNNSTHVQPVHVCEESDLTNNSTHVQPVHRHVQPVHKHVQRVHISLPSLLVDNTTTTPPSASVCVSFTYLKDSWMIEGLKKVHRKINFEGQEDYADEQLFLKACEWHISERVKDNSGKTSEVNRFVTDLVNLIRGGLYRFDKYEKEGRHKKTRQELLLLNQEREYLQELAGAKRDLERAIKRNDMGAAQSYEKEIMRLEEYANRLH